MKPLITIFLLFYSSTLFAQQQNIYFEFDSYTLSEKSKLDIDIIIGLDLDSIIIIGHCDSTGSLEYNQTLSNKRANATFKYITYKKPSLKISEKDGKSFLAPLKSNSTETNKSLNRRVELFYFTSKEKNISTLTKETPQQPIKTFKCQMIDAKNQFIPKGSITLYNHNNEILGTKSFSNGRITFNDSLGFDRVRIDGDIYFSQTITYNTVQDYCMVRLQKIKKNSYFTFKNLGFIPNEPNLLPSSFPELDGLLKTLRENPRLKIHIEGHTNGVNTKKEPSWHNEISKGRANSVYTYLTENGIDKDRLSFEGFGCTKMVFPHAANRAQAQENRRVEIRVTDF